MKKTIDIVYWGRLSDKYTIANHVIFMLTDGPQHYDGYLFVATNNRVTVIEKNMQDEFCPVFRFKLQYKV